MFQKRKTSGIVLLQQMIVLILCLESARGSGVFELEFIRLEQLDSEVISAHSDRTNHLQQPHPVVKSNNTEEQDLDPSKLVKILVCLKEAFTSQLDGPCTFGNASINLNRDSIQLSGSTKPPATSTTQTERSLLTNIVRIPFTFRWTVSSLTVDW